jgi:hypothetical protein
LALRARVKDSCDAYHDQSAIVVDRPGRESTLTCGGPDHRTESEPFCAAFADDKVRHPYEALFGQDEFTAFVTAFTGTVTGPLYDSCQEDHTRNQFGPPAREVEDLQDASTVSARVSSPFSSCSLL